MKRLHLLILIWVLFFSTVQAQDLRSDDEGTSIEPATSANKKLYFGLGGNFSSFQDVKYSSVQFSGIGGAFELGFTKQKESRQWTLGMQSEAGIERATTNDVVSSYFGNVLFYYRYTKALKRKVSIGGRLDLMDTYFRKNNGLGNNGLYYLIGSHLYFSTNYHKTLSKKWRVEAILDLGLLSFYKESTGFGFSAPQNALEAGGFNYQDEALTNPFGFKYYHFQHLGKQFRIKTSILFHLKKRLTFAYLWNMRRFATVKSYPTTLGIHTFTVRFNFGKSNRNRNMDL